MINHSSTTTSSTKAYRDESAQVCSQLLLFNTNKLHELLHKIIKLKNSSEWLSYTLAQIFFGIVTQHNVNIAYIL